MQIGWPCRLVLALALATNAGCLNDYIGGMSEADGGVTLDGAGPGGLESWDLAGVPIDEQFPPELLLPYEGPANTDYDNTFINYTQLRNKVTAVFADDWVRSGANQWSVNIALFGGVDFVTHFSEPREATSDFLLGLDLVSKDVCSKAAADRTGPFAGLTPATTTAEAAIKTGITQLYQKMLYRAPTDEELTSTYALYADLIGPTVGVGRVDAFAGVCEALLRHPDFLFTLPPSYATATGVAKDKLMLVKLTQDLAGRPPQAVELAALDGGKTLAQATDELLASSEFRDYFFYKMRLRTQSSGGEVSDEPARLWTYIAMNDAPMQDLFAGDYSVGADFAKVARPAEHGRTGLLTMKGFIQGKRGLPGYNYPARVLGDFMGVTFIVPPAVLEMRQDSTPATTVEPGSVCYSCHNTLTPLAYQRARWTDDGEYVASDALGAPIDDSDRGVVAGYPFAGQGMEGFATRAVKKESFLRQTINAHFIFLMGRRMRVLEDERVIYKQLWETSVTSNGKIKELLKVILNSAAYKGGQP